MEFFDLDIPQSNEGADSIDQMRLELVTGKPDEVWQAALQCFDLTAISDSFKSGARRGDSEGIFDYLRKQCSRRAEYAEYSAEYDGWHHEPASSQLNDYWLWVAK